ncbi:MAG: Crp/Fnr family transcriptional regulator [Methanobacteriota archaeon]|nr:MAG: Crp/Fnr family transcriptional regulator [Euryarchaeota archaeon]
MNSGGASGFKYLTSVEDGKTAAEILMKSPLFSHIKNKEFFFNLVSDSELLLISKNHTLIFEGEDSRKAFFILRGRMKILILDAKGHEVVCGMAERHETVGEAGVISGHKRKATVVADMDSLVLAVKQSRFISLLEDVQFSRKLLVLVSKRVDENNFYIFIRHLEVVYRVGAFLMREAERQNYRLTDPCIVFIPGRNLMAKLLGTSRETVCRALSRLESYEVIRKLEPCKIEINLDAMKEFLEDVGIVDDE